MRRTVSLAKNRASTEETQNMADANGWEQAGYFSSYLILVKDDLRRLVDPITGRVSLQYRIHPPCKEGDIDARL
ncbi:MAG: hypothetical protein KAV87_45495 [Desulfobacteraceae bacterium]|nr:hypothetical protein [Desulfobacteraceae bacterium]